MSVTLTIAGVDRSNVLEDVVINAGLGELVGAKLHVTGISPAQFQKVLITRGADTLFDGYADSPEIHVDGPAANEYDGTVSCLDDGFVVKDALVVGTFSGTLTAVVTAIMTQFAPSFTRFIDSFGVTTEVRYNYLNLFEVLKALALQGPAHLFIRPGRAFYLFRETWGPTISLQYADVVTPYSHRKPSSQFFNDVLVLGGTELKSETQTFTVDGVLTTFALDHVPRSLKPYSDGVERSLGHEGFSNPAGTEAFLDRLGKKLRYATAPAMSASAEYQHETRVIERQTDSASVAALGRTITKLITDPGITTSQAARTRARGELLARAKMREVLTLRLTQYQTIWPGQRLYLAWLARSARVVTTKIVSHAGDEDIVLEVELL